MTGIRHYILTRSAYGPGTPIETNRLRLELLRRVTAPSIAAQTERDVTWLALLDERDPLRRERVAALEAGGLPVVVGDAGQMVRTGGSDKPQGPWAKHIAWDRGTAVCTARLDDDDALAPWALAAVRAKLEAHNAGPAARRAVFTLPSGWRVVRDRADLFDAPTMMNWDEGVPWISQFSTFYCPPGQRKTMLDVRHGAGHTLGPLVLVTNEPAWLWLRHSEARSNYTRHSRDRREGMPPVTTGVRAQFPVDWDFIAGLEA